MIIIIGDPLRSYILALRILMTHKKSRRKILVILPRNRFVTDPPSVHQVCAFAGHHPVFIPLEKVGVVDTEKFSPETFYSPKTLVLVPGSQTPTHVIYDPVKYEQSLRHELIQTGLVTFVTLPDGILQNDGNFRRFIQSQYGGVRRICVVDLGQARAKFGGENCNFLYRIKCSNLRYNNALPQVAAYVFPTQSRVEIDRKIDWNGSGELERLTLRYYELPSSFDLESVAQLADEVVRRIPENLTWAL